MGGRSPIPTFYDRRAKDMQLNQSIHMVCHHIVTNPVKVNKMQKQLWKPLPLCNCCVNCCQGFVVISVTTATQKIEKLHYDNSYLCYLLQFTFHFLKISICITIITKQETLYSSYLAKAYGCPYLWAAPGTCECLGSSPGCTTGP